MALGNWPALSWVLAVLKLPTSNFSLFFATVKISIIHLVTKACRKLGLWYFSAASLHSNSYKLLRTSFMFLSHILESVTSPFPIVIWNLVPFRNESISANHPPLFFCPVIILWCTSMCFCLITYSTRNMFAVFVHHSFNSLLTLEYVTILQTHLDKKKK